MHINNKFLICFLAICFAGCGDNTTGVTTPVLPHSPVDYAWKAVENLEYAYNTEDLELIEATLDPDFFHHLQEADWDDYDGDGIVDEGWSRNMELLYIENLFATVSDIDMDFTGDEESSWSEDSTGQALMLPRTFNVTLWLDPDHSDSLLASGSNIYICRPDSANEWYIWHTFSLQELWWPSNF